VRERRVRERREREKERRKRERERRESKRGRERESKRGRERGGREGDREIDSVCVSTLAERASRTASAIALHRTATRYIRISTCPMWSNI
jgi:hypothetical protein